MSESPESLTDYPAELTPPATLKKPEREGLPPGYRMRADAHYVDQLASARSERAPGERGSRRADADALAEVRERRIDQILAQLTEDLATIGSAASLLSGLTGDGSPMARRVNLDLIRVQAWRAAWLLRAHALADGSHRGQIRARQLGAVLAQVREGFAPECRLAGVGLQIDASDWQAAVAVDDAALVAGLTGAVVATLGLVGEGEWAAIRIAAAVTDGELRTIDVVQEDAAAPQATAARFFDATWTARPGGWTAALGAATAKAVAQLHGGDASFVVGERRGTTIRLKF